MIGLSCPYIIPIYIYIHIYIKYYVAYNQLPFIRDIVMIHLFKAIPKLF